MWKKCRISDTVYQTDIVFWLFLASQPPHTHKTLSMLRRTRRTSHANEMIPHSFPRNWFFFFFTFQLSNDDIMPEKRERGRQQRLIGLVWRVVGVLPTEMPRNHKQLSWKKTQTSCLGLIQLDICYTAWYHRWWNASINHWLIDLPPSSNLMRLSRSRWVWNYRYKYCHTAVTLSLRYVSF